MKIRRLLLIPLLLLVVNGCSDKDTPEGPPDGPGGGNYVPGDPSDVEGDVQIKVWDGEASQYQGGENIEKSWDGDMKTLYHSPYYGTKFPVTLEYRFKEPEDVDYIVYKPRSGGDNGPFGEFELHVATKVNPEFSKLGEYDFKFSNNPSPINFGKTLEGATAFKFIIKTGGKDFVSCAEMEFWRYGEGTDVSAFGDIFADEVLSELREDITRDKIEKMNNAFFKTIALALFDDKYDMEFRVQEYEPYPTREETAQALKIGEYCPFENPTGIYFSSGTDVIVIVGGAAGESLSLQIHSFAGDTGTTFYLREGINKFTTKTNGLAYVSYFTTNWENAPKVKIHIATGKVNGYLDVNKHTSADWSRLIGGAVSSYFDLKGNYVNICYTTKELKQYCADGWRLATIYDEIVNLEHDIMGLIKYDRRPKNHMFVRCGEGWGLFADGWGAGFGSAFLNELADLDKCRDEGLWALAHEFGHVNQISPGLKWVGTTEVTNNIYSVVAKYAFTPNSVGLEKDRDNDGDNNFVLGGRMNSYLNYGVLKGEVWQCQRGQDKMEDYYNGGDYGVKLCPLWQLMLYYRIGNTPWKKKDWYGDVAEIVRNTDRAVENARSNGEHQLNFMKLTMDVIGEDLTDFFQKCGMLKPVDREIDDYARGWLKITQKDCDDMVEYAKKYKKPTSPVIYYISSNCLEAFEKQLPVTGTFGQGVILDSAAGTCIIDHNKWKNATVFETYSGNNMTKIAMAGTDSEDSSTTLVRYPAGSTRIEAVAWDGTRTLVYGER